MEPLPYAPGDLIVAPGVTYRVQKLLGSGGMGFVLQVLERELNDTVVLKFLKPHCVAALGDRFAREARVIRRIKDANVVIVERMGVTDDPHALPFYQMEFLAGSPLHAVRARAGGRLELRKALNVGSQLASGLSAIHERGLIHLDIKPANLILCRPGADTVLKIIDFGIAALAGEANGAFCGTPLYAAPEQLLEEECTSAVDVFAAGLVLYELLSGVHPYRGMSAKEDEAEDAYGVARRRVKVEAAPLSNHGDFPPALTRLVARMLELTPERRPEALKLAIELQKISAALEPINVHEAVTDPGLGSGDDLSPHTEVRNITHADVGNPTDQDENIPAWMAALRAEHKRAAILGVAPRDLPVATIGGPDARANVLADTEPGRPALPNYTAPMLGRPRLAEAMTDPPSRDLPPPAPRGGAIVYADAPASEEKKAPPAPPPSMPDPAKREPRAPFDAEGDEPSGPRTSQVFTLPVLIALAFSILLVGSALWYVRATRIPPQPPSPATSTSGMSAVGGGP